MTKKYLVANSIKLLLIANLLTQFVRWGVTIVVIRILLPNDYAIVALSESVLGFLEVFSAFGLSALVIRKQNISEDELKSIFGLDIIIKLISFVALVSISGPVARFYSVPELSLVFKILALAFLFQAFETIPGAMLTKHFRFKTVAAINIASGISGAVVTLIIAQAGYGYWALVIGGLTIQFTRALLKFVAFPIKYLPSFPLSKMKGYVSFGGFMTGSSLIGHLVITADVIIAGRFWTAEVLGYYAVAIQIAVLPLSKIMPHIKQVALPAYSEIQSDRAVVLRYLVRSLQISLTICVPVFFGIASVSPLLVQIFLGDTWIPATVPLLILCVAMPFRMMMELVGPPVVALGNAKIIFNNTLITLAVMLPSIYFIASSIESAEYLAFVWLISYPAVSLVVIRNYCKFLEISSIELLRTLTKPLLNGCIMLAAVWGLGLFLSDKMSQWPVLALSVACGGIVYISLTYVLDRRAFYECYNLLTKTKA